jgi:hypothetical protein
MEKPHFATHDYSLFDFMLQKSYALGGTNLSGKVTWVSVGMVYKPRIHQQGGDMNAS